MKTLKLALMSLISILMVSSIQSMEEEHSKDNKRKWTDNTDSPAPHKKPRQTLYVDVNLEDLKTQIKNAKRIVAFLKEQLKENDIRDTYSKNYIEGLKKKIRKVDEKLTSLKSELKVRSSHDNYASLEEDLEDLAIRKKISALQTKVDKRYRSKAPLLQLPDVVLELIFDYCIAPEPTNLIQFVPMAVKESCENLISLTSVCKYLSGYKGVLSKRAKQYFNNILLTVLATHYAAADDNAPFYSTCNSRHLEIALISLVTAGVDYHEPLNINTIKDIPLKDLIVIHSVGGEYAMRALMRKMRKNMDIDIQDSDGNTLFMRLLLALIYPPDAAKQFTKPQDPRIMLQYGRINIGLQNNDGNNAVMLCASSTDTKVLPLITDILRNDSSFDLNATNNDGDTALLILIKSAKQRVYLDEALRYLLGGLTNKIDFNIQDKDSNTAIMLLVKYGNHNFDSLFDAMVEQGARLDIINKDGQGAKDLTKNRSRLDRVNRAIANRSASQ